MDGTYPSEQHEELRISPWHFIVGSRRTSGLGRGGDLRSPSLLSTMTHALARNVIGSSAILPITAAEYAQLLVARDAVLDLLFTEEKFDLVVQNYIELETELLGSTLQDIITNVTDWQWFQNQRSLLNRRLQNLLSATRGYLEYFRHAIHELLGRNSPKALACANRLSSHYDSCLGYRVMEALRNHTQHRGFPIHVVEISSEQAESELRNRFKFCIAVSAKTSFLREDKKFKAGVLHELEALGEIVDLKPMIRDYVAAVADVHEFLREQLNEDVASWEGQIESAIGRFSATFPSEPSLNGLTAFVLNGTQRSEVIPIFFEMIQYRRHLAATGSSLKRLGVFYVSGETIASDV